MKGRTSHPLCSLGVVLGLAVLVVSLAAGCGKANPVAPSGSTVTLSANPSAITSPTGSSTITAVVRKPNGTVAAGVDVRFTASLGTIDTLVRTDSGGVATATLRGDGRSGTAMVNALVDGGGTAMALSVPIGGGAKSITLQALPASISVPGSTRLVALVRDAVGNPAPGVLVNFSTNVGSLSNGGLDTTGANGEASVTLTVKSTDISTQTSATVGATAAAPDGTLQTATFTVNLLTGAATSISVSANPGTLKAGSTNQTVNITAIVQNALGAPVPGANVTFSTTLGRLASGGAIRTTDQNGQAFDTLTVDTVPASGTSSITITAKVVTAGGTQISNTATITITP
jgi:adhesin/invasin